MAQTFFTADIHFGHANVIKFCNRPFRSVEEMNKVLIDNWNSHVSDEDDIYILGDLFFRTKTDIEDTLSQLHGRKHLIIGNHDHTWMSRVNLDKWFVSVNELLVLKQDGRTMTLCHYPLVSWPHMAYGGWCIHGHVHNNTDNEHGWQFIRQSPRLLNAGVDVNGYLPVTFDELVTNNEMFKAADLK